MKKKKIPKGVQQKHKIFYEAKNVPRSLFCHVGSFFGEWKCRRFWGRKKVDQKSNQSGMEARKSSTRYFRAGPAERVDPAEALEFASS